MQDHQPPLPAGSPTEEQLAAILRYTRRPFAPEELYVFPAVLCDNQIDRDGERFSTACLHQLAELFAGVTGVFDHRATASGQHARIFSCRVEEDPSRESNCPEPYAALRAEIYMPRTDATAALIAEIDAGIKKEVSVSCAVSGSVCSVCGQPAGSCAHQKGRLYDGPCPCHTVHTGAADAYEWSFVAVPAQRGAGVTKRLKRTAEVPPPRTAAGRPRPGVSGPAPGGVCPPVAAGGAGPYRIPGEKAGRPPRPGGAQGGPARAGEGRRPAAAPAPAAPLAGPAGRPGPRPGRKPLPPAPQPGAAPMKGDRIL